MRKAYGFQFPDSYSDYDIALHCFRHSKVPHLKAEHFWRITQMLWGPKSSRPFVRNPWSEEMILEACKWSYLSVSGAANCSKSDTFAVWGIVNYLCDPTHTTVLCTSTGLKDSRFRIWASVEGYWQAVPGLPGKLVSSLGAIRYESPDGLIKSDKCGIHLIAGDRRKEKEAIGKLIGIKNERVILIADELPELSHAILEASLSNLSSQPFHQLVGLGNPKSRTDPHGVLSTPKAGWSAITSADFGWETELGYCIRFDATFSPNVVADDVLFPFLPTKAKLDKAKKQLGENSLNYWRMWRGFWNDDPDSNNLYSETDLVCHKGFDKNVRWKTGTTPTILAGFDPGFTNGGDKSRLHFGLLGENSDGVMELLATDTVLLSEDRDSPEPRNTQIAKKFRMECEKRGCLPENAAFDCTGAGTPFGDIVGAVWSGKVYAVQFGGAPTSMMVGTNPPRPATEVYSDRVSQLWGVGVDFLRGEQLKGISAPLAAEMIERKKDTRKKGDNCLIEVESKKDMRKRANGASPDLGDAYFIMLDLAQVRHKFRPVVAKVINEAQRASWNKFANTNNHTNMPTALNENGFTPPPRKVPWHLRLRGIQVEAGGWGSASLRSVR